MKPITADATVVATEDQVSSTVTGGVVILQMKNGVYYSLDPVGAYIWEQIKKPATVRELCTAVESEYDVDPERCQRDVLELLNNLAKANLIRIR